MIKIILLSVIVVIIITTFIIYYKFIFDKKIRNFIEEGKFHFTQKNERIKLFHFLLFLITNSVFIILLIKNTGLNKLDIILFLIVNISFLIVSWWINIKFPIEHNQINIDNSKTFKNSQTNNHLEQINNVTNVKIVEKSIQSNNQDIFNFKKLKETEIIELFESNINNIYEDSKDDFLLLLKGIKPKNKIIWKGTSGKGINNITYTGIFILLNKILNLPRTKLERENRKNLIEFIIKTFKKYNPDNEKNCNEIAYSTLNTAYTNFNL
ncbi:MULTISPECIES: hypothetical protein [unclassified Empedobacter]|uniref:hypothetical protein n=1 Tax=unclassified Empedobacter TaxID=2643773 RepID=UPI0025C4C1D5|nr:MULTISPECIES: hypothetical protein [unclassified Empedobacter]